MPFDRPTREAIINRIAADFKVSISGATTIALRSVLQIFARVYGGAVHLLYGYLDNMSRQRFAQTATGVYLELQAAEYGIQRNAAVKATGTVECTGVVGTLIPKESELRSSDGLKYITDADANIGGAGSVDVDVTARIAGAASNDNEGISLTFVTPIVDVDTTAIVDSDGITGGTDEEEDSGLRERLLLRKQQAPHSGTANDLISWTKEVSGVTRAWVIKQYQGPGTVALFFTRDDDPDISPNETQIAGVKNHLIEHTDTKGNKVGVPVTMEPGLFVLAPDKKSVDFSIAIHPNTTAVQDAVREELKDIIYRDGGPGNTLYLSQVNEAISSATGEIRHRLMAPVGDVAANTNEVHVLGTITWSDY